MKKNLNRIIFRGILAVLLLSTLALGIPEKLYVSSKGAQLKTDRSAGSATVKNLAVGDELSVLSYESRWYQVKTKDRKTGWIYRGKVSETRPETADDDKATGGLGGLLDTIAESSIEAGAADSSRSIRGLSPEAEAYSRQTGKPKETQNALDSVLERKITDADIETLLKTGHIGEYAE